MKCPKCGYNSFEFLDACKKCGVDLGTFKKSHRINTVLRPAVAVPTELPQQAAPAAAQTPAQTENLHESFDLGFPETPQEQTADQGFSGFSFSDEPAAPAEISSPSASEELEDFSFDEPEEEESQPSSWDIKFDEDGSGLDSYERIIEPENIDFAKDETGNVGEDLGSFGTSDFEFETEASQDDIFAMEEKDLDQPVAPEKKPQPNMEDFDKEFEMIFADEDSGDNTTK